MKVLSKQEFADAITDATEHAKAVPQSTTLCINELGHSVELLLDNKANYYGEWIKGEGGDICLYRDSETDKVIGCCLPLYHKNLIVGRIPGKELEDDDSRKSSDNSRDTSSFSTKVSSRNRSEPGGPSSIG